MDVEGWWDELDRLLDLVGPRFGRSEPRERARRCVDGLVAGLERKNGWTLAEHAGELFWTGCSGCFGGRAGTSTVSVTTSAPTWSTGWDIPGAVLVADDTGFVKKGDKSAGVQRHGVPILIRSDSAGCTHGLLAHIRDQREQGVDARFSVGVAITEPIRQAILTMKKRPGDRIPALDGDGEPRPGAHVCELTGLVPDDGYPPGTRFIVRRERPHPGAQLSLFDTIEGLRHQVMATDTPPGLQSGGGSIQYLEARHRGHARVEDRIRTGKDTGFGRFPSRIFAINAAWLQLALTGIDLLAWTQLLLLDGELATAEPKKLRLQGLVLSGGVAATKPIQQAIPIARAAVCGIGSTLASDRAAARPGVVCAMLCGLIALAPRSNDGQTILKPVPRLRELASDLLLCGGRYWV